MALVGDVIMASRDIFPDLPSGVLAAPGAEVSVASIVTPAGGTSLPAATNYWQLTYLNPWGETIPAAQGTTAVAAVHTLQVTGTLPPGVTAIRLYQGLTTGIMVQYFQSDSLPFTIDASTGLPGIPPTLSSAFLPDTDGQLISAATIYRWLGEAYDKAGLLTRGIRDETGLQTIVGEGTYNLVGRWSKINNAWFDGWLMSRQGTLNFYYHNTATGISWMLDCTKVSNTGIVVQLWPQANRTGSTGALSSSITATDTTANLTLSTGFLPLGMVKIGTEIMGYNLTGAGSLLGLVRGQGGTVAKAWPTGTAVTELNVRIQGIRIPTKPTLGSAYNTVDLPFGWESILSAYLIGKMREAEQDTQASQIKFAEFTTALKDYARSNKQLSGPVQVGGVARETYGSGLGGGWCPLPPATAGGVDLKGSFHDNFGQCLCKPQMAGVVCDFSTFIGLYFGLDTTRVMCYSGFGGYHGIQSHYDLRASRPKNESGALRWKDWQNSQPTFVCSSVRANSSFGCSEPQEALAC